MTEILHSRLPDDMPGASRLPGVAPCAPEDWLRVDEAYGPQMAYRRQLLEERREAVYCQDEAALAPAREVLEEAVTLLPAKGFEVGQGRILCPDGESVVCDADQPLLTLGRAVQEDICILEKRGNEHLLTAAVLCFPANWRLAEKIGKPLTAIHEPVSSYDADIARRVQRLFDGVRVGRPLWRSNWLTYSEADLHQPRRRREDGEQRFIRSERQCILRLPVSGAVVFTIHTYVLDRASLEEGSGGRDQH